MHLKGLDLNLLIILDVLLTEKNVTRTGERVNLSQSATSGALARLRDYFNDNLLIQVGQRMELTPFAEQLTNEIHEIISKCEAIVDRNQSFDPESSSRTFRINISDSSAAVILHSAIAKIQKVAPHIKFEITSMIDEPISEYLEKGYLDLIITPRELVSSRHPSELVFDDQFICAVWKDSFLAHNELDLDTYLSNGHIVARFSKIIGWALDESFIRNAGYHRRVDVVASSFSMLIHQIIDTNLIATVHERFANYYSQYFPIKILKCPVDTKKIEMLQQWHKNRTNDLGIKWLRAMLMETSKSLPELTKFT
ncbi:LysR family transcriptional regulator [uncultured Tolumonas sp.]|uniref:LysR family transcriptional regulator n=1 Tax=uncultured Tolumonas sp. TaxID=263765 RepID=UPI00292D43AC|nr:LysR family transcriptional regulator [uncultured Tolumonas sp.]